MKKGKLTDKVILFGRDLIKGYVTDKKYSTYFHSLSPWQMVSLEEKTEEWFMWNLDWFEAIGLSQVEKSKGKILRNRRLATGILDPNDYMAHDGDFSHLSSIVLPDDYDPLQQFYPLAPPVYKVMLGEFQKRDNHIQVECIDKYSINDKLKVKQDAVLDATMQYEQSLKEKALQKLGITFVDPQEMDPNDPNTQKQQEVNKQFEAEMNLHMQLKKAEQKFKTYKHKMELWGQHIVNIDTARFYMDEQEAEGFGESLANAREFWHIDLLENDYRVELLDSANCFWHKTSNVRYISEGDYFGWFEEMTIGDIINKLGKRLNEEQFENIKKFLDSTISLMGSGALLTNDQKAFSDAYYDPSIPYPFGAKNIPMENTKERMYYDDFLTTNFGNASSYELMDKYGTGLSSASMPKIFKVMRCYWKSQRKIGWLTKIGKDGVPLPGIWIDENFKVTEKPIYDNTITKEKTKNNLVYGEHVDWEWVNEWRHGIKIARNLLNKFWNSTSEDFQPIYIDGEPVKFQFKGKDDVYQSLPPVEGCIFNMKGVREVSFIDTIAPYQIIYNICENKTAQMMVDDFGKLLYHNQATVPRNTMSNSASTDLISNFYEEIKSSKIIPGNIDKDVMQVLGANAGQVPQVIDMSIIQEAIHYKELGRMIKEDAYEAMGITRQRLGQQKASETATGIEGAINYSEVQTEPLFVQHSNYLMPRVYQRMIEAAQFYVYKEKESKVMYRNENEENVLLEIENLDGLLRDYNVYCTNKPKTKMIKEKLEQLFLNDNTLEASALDRAEVMVSKSVSETMDKLRNAQAKKELADQEKMKHEQEMQEKQIAADQEALEKELTNENKQKELDRESAEKIAMFRMLAGLQTDVDANAVPDAQDNLEYLLKQKKVDSDISLDKDKLDLDKQKHNDTLEYQNKELLIKAAIEQKKLAAALANQNKNDDKKLNRKIAKSQGVTKK